MTQKQSYEELENRVKELEHIVSGTKQSDGRLLSILSEAERLSNFGAWEWDMVQNVWTMSDNWLKIHGYTGKVLTTEELLTIAYPDDINKIQEAFNQCINNGKPYEIEHRIVRHETKEVRYIRAHGRVESDSTGKPVKLYGTAQDITEYKRQKVELNQSEKKYRSLVERTPDLFTMVDSEGRIVFVNHAAQNVYGLSPQECLGRSAFDFVHPEDRDATVASFNDWLRCPDNVLTYENRIVNIDGQRKYNMAWMILPERDESGSIIGFSGTARDITEKKQAEEQSLKQQYYLEKAQELGRIGTWELEIINNILVWTDENCRIFGVPPGSIVNYEVFIEKVHPEDREYVEQEWLAAIEGKQYDIEHRIEIAGETRWVREKADITFDSSGTAVSAIGFTQDITESKLAEEELVKNQQLLAKMGQVSKIGGWEFDIATGFLQWTEEVYRIHEIGLDYAPTLKNALEFYSDTSKPVIAEAVQRAIEHGEPFDLELEIITANGNHRSVHALGVTDLESRRVYGVFQDITDRKKTENELQRHKDSLDELVAERTEQLNRTLKLMTGREARMAELKKTLNRLKAQLVDAGIKPEIDDNYGDPSAK